MPLLPPSSLQNINSGGERKKSLQLATIIICITVGIIPPMTLSLHNISLQIYISNPDYGCPVADLGKQKLRTLLIVMCCVTIWDDTTPTLWCSHKVNVKLHSAAALQQWAFKLIWLAVKPHAGARTRGHTRTHGRADTQTHIHAGLTLNTVKVSDIVMCTGKEKVEKPCYLPWALCRGVSHHHTFSYFSEFTKIVSKAVCE